ncbi:MAG TPA: formyltetrahydrofolate deformylase [Kofleriaceae bacterium]|nr:formyltetrahydrofolate deformylase [Kofleriaceae bacterium]
MAEQLGTLLVSCPDQKGIVAALAQVLYGQGANIVDSDQHTDPIAGMFFQRICFDLSTAETDPQKLEAALRDISNRFELTYRLIVDAHTPRVAIFCSKQEHCLYDLLIRYRAGELPCHVAMIISNHPTLEPVAKHFDVPFVHLPITAATKAQQEAAAIALLERENVDLVILARYMQILSPEFVARYPSRIINIHHSFLPAFIGANPYRQAYERGVKLIGATSHYVTSELDQGPIIEQAVVRCSHRDHVDELVRKGKDLEKRALARAVRLHLQDRILVYSGKTVVFD